MKKALSIAALLLAGAARADELRLISPNEIDYREIEIEHEGSAARGGGRDYSLDIGTGPTQWWHVGAELEFEREPRDSDNGTALQGYTLENQIRLTRPGENWADAAIYSEFTHSAERGVPDDGLLGALFLKDIGHTTTMVNLFFDRAFSDDDDYSGVRFSYSAQTRWNLYRQFAPSIEAFGSSGRVDRPDSFPDGQFIIGPVATGAFLLGPIGKLRYEAGYLFGASAASPSGTIRWKMELEIPL